MKTNTRLKQFIISSDKQIPWFCYNNNILFNINSCFPKKDHIDKYGNILDSIKKETNITKLNLCNLASYCYKVGIIYASEETLDFIRFLKEVAEQKGFKIVQENITNYWETDCKPINHLIKTDKQNNILYAHNVLLDCLKLLGYETTQLVDILDLTTNLKNIIPIDMIQDLPINSKKNLGCYNMIKEILC